jgi:hypothetical protein
MTTTVMVMMMMMMTSIEIIKEKLKWSKSDGRFGLAADNQMTDSLSERPDAKYVHRLLFTPSDLLSQGVE